MDQILRQIKPRALLMEVLGTFSLIFMGGWGVFSAVAANAGVLIAALVHGAVLGVFIYIGAKISGANYNPAVSIALTLIGALSPINCVLYIICQFWGSFFGGIAL